VFAGIAWMYFYTFAIAGEVGPVVSIVNLWPWKDAAEELHKIDLSRVIDVGRNKGLEGITYDSERECLYATQEQDPKTVGTARPGSAADLNDYLFASLKIPYLIPRRRG
jgi:uncharacterized protein YjiK